MERSRHVTPASQRRRDAAGVYGAGSDHPPLNTKRHAAVVVELMHHNAPAYMAVFWPSQYVYDERDTALGAELDTRCQELRIAFQSVRGWEEMLRMVRRLVHLERKRRRLSVGVVIDGRVIKGEAIE